MTKIQIENNLQYHLKQRRVLKREVKVVEKTLENLTNEDEDNEATIKDLRDCLKNKIYS